MPGESAAGTTVSSADKVCITSMDIDAAHFRSVLGRYPTGVCAITSTTNEGEPTGMIVGSFTSVSLDPPLVGFFPDRSSSTWPVIAKTGRFAANVLSAGQQSISRQLSTKGPDKFAGVCYRLTDLGLPALEGALATIECNVESVTDAGDHLFVLGRVVTLRAEEEGNPMLFFCGRYGSFAQ